MEDGYAISQAKRPQEWLSELSVPPEERPLLKDSGSDLSERVIEALRVSLSESLSYAMTESWQKSSDGGWHQVQRNIHLLGVLYGMAEVPANAVLDIPQDIDYWCKLRKTGRIDMMWPFDLKLQSETLLVRLIGYSNGTFEWKARDELSKHFSASQNRCLLGRVLHGRNSRPSPLKKDDQQLAFLLGEKSADFIAGWRTYVTGVLSLEPPMLDVSGLWNLDRFLIQ